MSNTATKIPPEDLPRQFLTQQNCLTVVKVLCRITKALQKHRGASTACLDGDIKFTPVLLNLQSQVGSYLGVLSHLNRQNAGLLPQQMVANIFSEWDSIVSRWQKDEVVENYEFHSHLIEVVSKLQRSVIANFLLQPLAESESAFRAEFEQALIALTTTIESVAKLRGIATHVAAVKRRDNDLYLRMEFLVKTVPTDAAKLYYVLQELNAASFPISGLNHLVLQQNRIEALLELIDSSLINSTEIAVSSEKIFEQATTIIDTYWTILDQCITAMDDTVYSSFA